MVKTWSFCLTWPWIRTGLWQTDRQTDRIAIANTRYRLQQYLPVQLWRVQMLPHSQVPTAHFVSKTHYFRPRYTCTQCCCKKLSTAQKTWTGLAEKSEDNLKTVYISTVILRQWSDWQNTYDIRPKWIHRTCLTGTVIFTSKRVCKVGKSEWKLYVNN